MSAVRWRADGHRRRTWAYHASMGPIRLLLTRWGGRGDENDEWGYELLIGDARIGKGHHYRKGAPLEQCKADAVAHVERWRDSIRAGGRKAAKSSRELPR